MHPLYFMQKRVHRCSVARGLEMFQQIEDMTPARFDFLYVLHKHTGALTAIREKLGLARQTVWKTMERLVELGLIVKQKLRRSVFVAFTVEGARRMRHALSVAFNEAPVRLIPGEEALTMEERWTRFLCAGRVTTAALSSGLSSRSSSGDAKAEANEANAANHSRFESERLALPVGRSRRRFRGAFLAYTLASSDYELRNTPPGTVPPRLPTKRGREVGRIYALHVWHQTPLKRKRRRRYLDAMTRLIELHASMARSLGNYTPSIYRIDMHACVDPEVLDFEVVKTRVHRGGRVERTYRAVRLNEDD